MPLNDKENRIDKRQKGRRVRLAYIVVILLLVWIIIDAVGIGGNMRFYAKWVQCGQKPVVKFIEYGSVGPNYGPSHYIEAPNFAIFRLSPDQFCTPIEAERAGLSADENTWVFPNLEAAGEENPFLKDLNLSR